MKTFSHREKIFWSILTWLMITFVIGTFATIFVGGQLAKTTEDLNRNILLSYLFSAISVLLYRIFIYNK